MLPAASCAWAYCMQFTTSGAPGPQNVGMNQALDDAPDLVNTQPYEEGWMIEVKPDSPQELDGLMDKAAYVEMLKGME